MPRPVATALTLAVCATSAAASPSGRVIRVERPRGSAPVAPRLCEIRGDAGTCVGEQPRIGQTVFVLDEKRVYGEVQVVESGSYVANCPNLWAIKTRAVRGAGALEGLGVIDAGMNPTRAHALDKAQLPPSPSATGEEVWRALDRDGDGSADIMITRYNCDASGKPTTGGTGYCFDVWARLGTKITRTTQLNVTRCNI